MTSPRHWTALHMGKYLDLEVGTFSSLSGDFEAFFDDFLGDTLGGVFRDSFFGDNFGEPFGDFDKEGDFSGLVDLSAEFVSSDSGISVMASLLEF